MNSFHPILNPTGSNFPPPGSGDEMTLDEWVGRLPDGHRARKELGLLRRHIEALTDELYRTQTENRTKA